MRARFFNHPYGLLFDYEIGFVIGYLAGQLDYLKEDPTDHSVSGLLTLFISLPAFLNFFPILLNALKNFEAIPYALRTSLSDSAILHGFSIGVTSALKQIDSNCMINSTHAGSVNKKM